MKEIIARLKLPTPKFWTNLRNFFLYVLAASTAPLIAEFGVSYVGIDLFQGWAVNTLKTVASVSAVAAFICKLPVYGNFDAK